MALPQNGTRRIVVEGVAYRWVAAPNDGYISLVVERADEPGQRLGASFKYHDVLQAAGAGTARIVGQRRSVSPRAVRAVILAALGRGWQPSRRGLSPFSVPDAEQLCPVGGPAA